MHISSNIETRVYLQEKKLLIDLQSASSTNQALNKLDAIAGSDPTYATRLIRANVNLSNGAPQKALDDLDQVIAVAGKSPNLYQFHDARAAALLGLGKKAEALSEYGKALELSPGASSVYLHRAAFLASKGEYGAALDDLRMTVLGAQRESTGKNYVLEGVIYELQNNDDSARKSYERADGQVVGSLLHAFVCRKLGDTKGYKEWIRDTGSQEMRKEDVEKEIFGDHTRLPISWTPVPPEESQ